MAGWSISDRRLPSAVERAELGARRDALFRSLAAACERACEADRDEYRRLNQIFSAQQVHEPDEAERARVTEAFEKLAKDIGLRDPYATEKLRRDAPSAPKETHDEALARLAREYAASPVGLTPEELKGRLA